MRALYSAAALLLSFACANAGEIHPSPTLTILFQFDQPYAQHALAEAEREVSLLTKDAAVKLEWRDRTATKAGTAFQSILVLNFEGACDPRSERSFTGSLDGWLARMHVSDGVVLPFGEVNCDLVRALLNAGSSKTKPHDKVNDKVFGRALARVLAHELYHYITQSTEHATEGLVKPSFSRKDLTGGDLTLNRQEIGLLANSMIQ